MVLNGYTLWSFAYLSYFYEKIFTYLVVFVQYKYYYRITKNLAKYINTVYIFNFDSIALNKNNSVLFNTTNMNATVYT